MQRTPFTARPLVLGFFVAAAAACGNDPVDATTVDNGSLDNGAWWAVDAGGGGDADAAVATNDAAAEKDTSGIDQICYDGCIKKGQPESVCVKACPDDGGKGGAGVDPVCYNGCIKKGQPDSVCSKACASKTSIVPKDASWAEIHAKLIKPTCAGGDCHGGGAGAGTLKLTGDAKADYDTLLSGKHAPTELAACVTETFVVPGAAKASLLWLKVDAKAAQGCGTKMPPKSNGLSAELSGLIAAWIDAGAKL